MGNDNSKAGLTEVDRRPARSPSGRERRAFQGHIERQRKAREENTPRKVQPEKHTMYTDSFQDQNYRIMRDVLAHQSKRMWFSLTSMTSLLAVLAIIWKMIYEQRDYIQGAAFLVTAVGVWMWINKYMKDQDEKIADMFNRMMDQTDDICKSQVLTNVGFFQWNKIKNYADNAQEQRTKSIGWKAGKREREHRPKQVTKSTDSVQEQKTEQLGDVLTHQDRRMLGFSVASIAVLLVIFVVIWRTIYQQRDYIEGAAFLATIVRAWVWMNKYMEDQDKDLVDMWNRIMANADIVPNGNFNLLLDMWNRKIAKAEQYSPSNEKVMTYAEQMKQLITAVKYKWQRMIALKCLSVKALQTFIYYRGALHEARTKQMRTQIQKVIDGTDIVQNGNFNLLYEVQSHQNKRLWFSLASVTVLLVLLAVIWNMAHEQTYYIQGAAFLVTAFITWIWTNKYIMQDQDEKLGFSLASVAILLVILDVIWFLSFEQTYYIQIGAFLVTVFRALAWANKFVQDKDEKLGVSLVSIAIFLVILAVVWKMTYEQTYYIQGAAFCVTVFKAWLWTMKFVEDQDEKLKIMWKRMIDQAGQGSSNVSTDSDE